ncbi:hypothetical protein OPV22_014710 [Ensete ventricosum]|uniref:Holocarboxylase synthetase n=1 Tax=Ensete ventricosum TaxID=4639 RepID=A0AAV8R3V1_ENSVE|nr:hypothetical protein OPV22_014710 [Ensete ventricosum]RWV89721.1 hypothetical protein GW17_00048119 [Ensete ventricosum]RWW67058.1 hypothetical protein BHE74_00025525 [Ensete ventricosum]RZS15176.1 hypothetical protein BHM03_00046981 [Ensete ventricosum]
MARKRKTEATRLDEVDRTLYSTFCSAANSLSQLYTQAMNQQKISYQAGERHAMEKLYEWILRKHEEGGRVTVADIVTHIQSEMDYAGEDALVSPRSSPFQHQSTMHVTNSGTQPTYGIFGQPMAGLAPRIGHFDQAKSSVFSNALSSPVRRSLQPYHIAQGGGFYGNGVLPTGNAESRSHHDPNENRGTNSLGSNDSSMDIHTDSLPHESY